MLEPVLQNPWVRAVGVLLALALACFLVYVLSPVLIPLLMAFLAAYLLDPVVDFFEKRKISRGVTIAMLACVGIGIVIALPLFMVPTIISQAQKLTSAADAAPAGDESQVSPSPGVTAPSGEEGQESATSGNDEGHATPGLFARVGGWFEDRADQFELDDRLRQVLVAAELMEEGATDEPRQVLAARVGGLVQEYAVQFLVADPGRAADASQKAGMTVAHFFASIGKGLVGVLVFFGNFALFAFVAGYLLKDFDGVVAGARNLVPPRYREKTLSIVGQIDRQLRCFLRGQFMVCACLGVMYAIGFIASGTPFGILVAIIGAVASFVPYLGVVLTACTALFLTLLQYGVDGHLLGVLITMVVAQALEGNVLTPKIVGEQVGLNPVWVILAILVFGNLLGFLGLLLAVPTAAALKVFVVEGVAYYRRSPVFAGAGGVESVSPDEGSEAVSPESGEGASEDS
ncbi:MAG: AI-2E family transporter [bacterium]|nr:AI-2E family transporter [bacterium]